MIEITVLKGNRILVPLNARKVLNVRAGDKVRVTVQGNILILGKA
jgi:bifunctional DNA-binding transcriptional regulator/antitoxin component of YhaV-PrlF toxin-antitoxin module